MRGFKIKDLLKLLKERKYLIGTVVILALAPVLALSLSALPQRQVVNQRAQVQSVGLGVYLEPASGSITSNENKTVNIVLKNLNPSGSTALSVGSAQVVIDADGTLVMDQNSITCSSLWPKQANLTYTAGVRSFNLTCFVGGGVSPMTISPQQSRILASFKVSPASERPVSVTSGTIRVNSAIVPEPLTYNNLAVELSSATYIFSTPTTTPIPCTLDGECSPDGYYSSCCSGVAYYNPTYCFDVPYKLMCGTKPTNTPTTKPTNTPTTKPTNTPTTKPIPTITPTPRPNLNSATGLTCNEFCQQRGQNCQSAGTDPAGTNNRMAIWNGGCTIMYSISSCSLRANNNYPYSCTDLNGTNSDKNAHTADWTYCNCFSAPTNTPIPTPTSSVCYDSDGGRNYYVAGYVTTDGGYHRADDSCTLESGVYTLHENYCLNNQPEVEAYVCTNGCEYGACLSQPACPRGEYGNLNCDPLALIDDIDLSILIPRWAPSGPVPTPWPGQHTADISPGSGDGKVDEFDLAKLLYNWKTE